MLVHPVNKLVPGNIRQAESGEIRRQGNTCEGGCAACLVIDNNHTCCARLLRIFLLVCKSHAPAVDNSDLAFCLSCVIARVACTEFAVGFPHYIKLFLVETACKAVR